jgi:outer membrane protein OmpA-like peptidoglycan-associated protein
MANRIWLALALLGAPLTGAAAQDFKPPQGWYLGAGAGWSWMQGTADFASINDTNLNYQGASRFSGAAGYKWHDWRAELEPDWVTNDAKLTGFGGGSTVAAVMANINYDWRLTDRWMLSLGAGIGGARVSHHIFSTSTTTATPLFFGGHGFNVAFQGIAGFGYALTHNIELGAEYRYMYTGDTNAVSQVSNAQFHSGQNHIVMASIRWYPFAHEEEAPPPPPPPAPPPPRPIAPQPPAPMLPPPVRTFVIFFDFDKSDVNPAAMAIVRQAVTVVKDNGFVRIQVTGHTDTAGSMRYNQALSERRAASVKAVMVGLGVPEGEITTQGRSFRDPLVPTGPNVREPQNRRAVIDLDK